MLAVRDASRLRICANELESDLAAALQGPETAPQFDRALKLAMQATNGWACYAKRKIEHDEIARLHRDIAALDPARFVAADAPAPAPRSRSRGAELIVAERERHLAVEGWTPEHDDGHTDGSLAGAAACLAVEGTDGDFQWVNYDDSWIAGLRDRHASTDRVRQLVIAGALIAAEIDRLLRARGEEVSDGRA